ncbi:FimD/PapC N-terminal domain-containing protein, partial [Escherichia coli]|nr:FimD/PapC N-terminal domain-containing protein [Escherichia coli]
MNNKNTFTGDTLSHAIKNALSGVVCSLLFVLPAHAVEFNVDMIDVEDRENIDISRFEKKGYIPPGRYLARVQINKNMLPQALILEWVKADNESGSLLCLTKEDLTSFGLNTEFIESLQTIAGRECLDLSQRQELTTRLDKATMILSLSVPQAWLKYQATNWTPPEFW